MRADISGRYRLRSEIGSGGMGTVWHAQDTLLQRAVAVKEIELPRAVAAEEREAIRKRVLREARAAAALNHPNAVTVFDVIEEDGKAFIVMECIAGRTLDEIVKSDGPLPDDRLTQITNDILAALELAHAAGIVHRDVKPANVMITDDGRTKLADFGIASVKDDPKITASGLILGSPSYMAPEQATHGESGPEADLWGLGATLYFAQEGVPPFDKQAPIPTLTAVVGEDPRPMEKTGALRPVIEALLAKDPTTRASARDVREMLAAPGRTPASPQPVTDDLPTTVALDEARSTRAVTRREERAEPAPTRTERDRRPWLWLAGVGAAVALAILAAMYFSGRDDTDLARDPEPKQKKEAAAGNSDAEEDSSESSAVDTDSAVAPEGWTTYEDPAIGYTIAHPADWDVEVRDEQNTFLHGPDGSFLQIGWRSPPDEAGPVGAWEEYEPSFASRQEGYERITIEPYDFKGMDAGWWEMTYEGLHAVNLGFITPDGEYGMALFFNTPEDEWESSQPLFEQFQATFQPPA